MICCCSLAGTSACKNCRNRAEFANRNNSFSLSDIPFTYMQTDKKLMDLEIAIRRLNERIDEILEEDNHEEDEDDLGCPCPYESDYACANCVETSGEE